MKIKYSPCKWNENARLPHKPNTEIMVKDENTIVVDEELYEFDKKSVEWPEIVAQTNGAILEAKRDGNDELYLTVRRFYTGSCSSWDSGDYHTMEAENAVKRQNKK